MPVLSNARHERFVRALADGASMDEALLIAGYKAGSGIAARLCARPDVVRRRAELRGGVPEAPPPQPSPASGRGGRALPAVMAISGPDPGMTAREGGAPHDTTDGTSVVPPSAPTRQWVLARLVDNVERALQLGELREGEAARGKYDGSVANRALELLGKELGMFTERSDNRQIQHDISDQPLSPEDWAKRHIVDP